MITIIRHLDLFFWSLSVFFLSPIGYLDPGICLGLVKGLHWEQAEAKTEAYSLVAHSRSFGLVSPLHGVSLYTKSELSLCLYKQQIT